MSRAYQFSCSSSTNFVLKNSGNYWFLCSAYSTLSFQLNTIGLDMKIAYPANGWALTIWLRRLHGRYMRKIGVTPQSYLLFKATPSQNFTWSHLSWEILTLAGLLFDQLILQSSLANKRRGEKILRATGHLIHNSLANSIDPTYYWLIILAKV